MFSESCIAYAVELIKSCLNNGKPPMLPSDITIDELYKYARFHKVEAIIYTELDKLEFENKSEVLEKFQQSYYVNVSISMQQQYCLDLIQKKFKEENILCIPLKGNVIKYLYPDPMLRSLSDIDIYIGKGNALRAREAMESLGFETLEYNSEVLIHDTYRMNRVHVELHNALMPQIPYFKGVEVCPDIESDIVLDENSKFNQAFSNEGFYAFMIIHIAKHIKNNGIGLRGFIDVELFLRKYSATLDWDKINDLMERSHLTQFNKCVLELVDYWFNDKEPSSSYIREFAELVADNGAAGNTINMRSEEKYSNISSGKRFSYYIKTVFLPLPYMKDKYECLKRYPVLLPFCWVHRIFEIVFSKKTRIKQFCTHFDGADVKKGEEIVLTKERIGL